MERLQGRGVESVGTWEETQEQQLLLLLLELLLLMAIVMMESMIADTDDDCNADRISTVLSGDNPGCRKGLSAGKQTHTSAFLHSRHRSGAKTL